jgi:hypothetical protein
VKLKQFLYMKLFKKITNCLPANGHPLSVRRLILLFLIVTSFASISRAQPSGKAGSFLISDPLMLLCPGVGQRKIDNEFTFNGQAIGNFYCNPLVLDGMAFEYNAFTLESKGELKLIKGDPKSGKATEISFYLRLRRNGTLVAHPCGEGVIFSKIEISAILKAAQDGDELIVEPVNKEDWPAKRIVRIAWDGC